MQKENLKQNGTKIAKKGKKFQKSGKRGTPRSKSDQKEFTYDYEDRDSRKPGSNDPAWYSTTPALLRDAASIPFSWSNGTPIDVNMPTSFPDGFIVPGVMAFSLAPTIGLADAPTSPVNIASTAVYSYVRHANSGHANYDAPDLMLYLIAMGNVYAYINHLMRIYACATLYSQRNRYLPTGLLKALNANVNDIQTHLADFRYGINVLIHKAASLAVPADMTYFRRLSFLYQNIYTEGTSVKDQLYLYKPQGFLKFGISATSSKGELTLVQLAGVEQGFTAQGFIDYGTALLDPILSSEDMNIMSGDILKAYGADKIMKLIELPEYVPIVPVFNIGVLEQMKNSFPTAVDVSTVKVEQSSDAAYLVSKPVATQVSQEMLGMSYLLTTTTAETTPELVMESTRLLPAYARREGTDNALIYCGSEIVAGVTIWKFNSDGTVKGYVIPPVTTVTQLSDLPNALMYTSEMSNFDFHPRLDIKYNGKHYPMFDLDNYAVLSRGNVQRLHEAALLSMFNVQSIGKLG